MHRAALPIAADGITQHVLELGPVEGAFALVERPRPAGGLQRPHECSLRSVPHRVLADALVGAIGEFDRDIGKTEVLVDREDQVVHGKRFGCNLAFRNKDMRIVLRERAHAHEPV